MRGGVAGVLVFDIRFRRGVYKWVIWGVVGHFYEAGMVCLVGGF